MTGARGGGETASPISRRGVVGALVTVPVLALAPTPGTDRPDRLVIRDGWVLLESDLA